jgi:hypothetical protein
MNGLAGKIRLAAALAIAAALVVIGVLNLRDRLSQRPIPDDGVYWVDTNEGIQARSINPDSPLAFRIKKGDLVRYIFYCGKYEKVERAETLRLYLDRIGVGGEARYTIERRDALLQNLYGTEQPLYDVDFKVVAAPQELGRGLYMALIGLVYLAIGVFVLLKRSRVALAYHFFAWFLASFVVYFYSATLEFTRLDKLVHFIDCAALALLAPLFLHFCAKFPLSRAHYWKLTYLPAATLILAEALFHYRPGAFGGGLLVRIRNLLDIAELSQYVICFAAGSGLLVRSYFKAHNKLLAHQLKWIIWGLGLSVIPFVGFYFVPRALGLEVPAALEAIGYGPLILIPAAFGYSIVRYRLMDVDVIMRRSFVHVVATVAVGAIYMAVLLAVGDLVKFIWATADLNSWKTRLVVVAGMLVVAALFAPIKNKLQEWADRWFYGERYGLRTGLQEFGRMLARTTALPDLLDSIAGRLSEMLSVAKVAIFIRDRDSCFKLARGLGLESEFDLPQEIEPALLALWGERGLVLAEDLGQVPQGELSYYVPCIVRDRMVAIIGVGRAQYDALLTSEDAQLLRALSGYVAVAIENSLLYRSEKERAQELARLKEFSESVIESVPVGICVISLDGRITTWNSAIGQMMGMGRDQALGCSAWEVFDADLLSTIQSATGRSDWAIAEPRHIYKYSASVGDGRQLTLNISLAPFEAATGAVAGMLIVMENVTERVRLEEQLLQSEKLSSIGLLAAGVAHEVNTPLAGISSYAQMLLDEVPEGDPKRTLLEKIKAQTDRASQIVNNLLNFSRTGDSQFRDVEINKVLDDTLQLVEPQLRSAKIEVICNYDSNLPPVYGNVSKLQQVFLNLILNARDAMPEGGRLTIQTRMVDSSLVIDFRDTGVGIPPEHIPHIYDPFFTTKEVGQGTGLGLAISYGIIQEHGGRIFVESRVGQGTHFTIKLPAATRYLHAAASD